jgi:uncharacterized protein VirK/YbjX
MRSSLLRATREDVIGCYRKFLKREPENERTIQHHLEGDPSVLDVAEKFFLSNEYKSRFLDRNHVSITKCFEETYLAMLLDIKSRLHCFSHHYQFLATTVNIDAFYDLIASGRILFEQKTDPPYRVKIAAPRGIINEGELCLTLESQERIIHYLSFTFVPGGIFGSTYRTVILLSRMQGEYGSKDLEKQVARNSHGAEPVLILFECLTGIAKATGVQCIVGVNARNQVCYRSEYEAVFRRSYDEFYAARGFEALADGFSACALQAEPKAKLWLSPAHRRRAARRRSFRNQIVEKAFLKWNSWL